MGFYVFLVVILRTEDFLHICPIIKYSSIDIPEEALC